MFWLHVVEDERVFMFSYIHCVHFLEYSMNFLEMLS